MAGNQAVSVVQKRIKWGPLEEALQVRVDADMRRRLESVVAETGEHISEVIRLLLFSGLDAHEGGKKKH